MGWAFLPQPHRLSCYYMQAHPIIGRSQKIWTLKTGGLESRLSPGAVRQVNLWKSFHTWKLNPASWHPSPALCNDSANTAIGGAASSVHLGWAQRNGRFVTWLWCVVGKGPEWGGRGQSGVKGAFSVVEGSDPVGAQEEGSSLPLWAGYTGVAGMKGHVNIVPKLERCVKFCASNWK